MILTFFFAHKILNIGVAALEKLMSDFSLHHRQASAAATSSFTPKTGDLVSAKFSKDDRWYRARVKRASAIKKEAQVYLIDYGDEDTVPFSKIRPLDEKFKSLPGQAKEARLRCVLRPFQPQNTDAHCKKQFRQTCTSLKRVWARSLPAVRIPYRRSQAHCKHRPARG